LAVAAQAFHWFDLPATMAELRRVLVAGCWAAALWNERRFDTPLGAEYEQLLQDRLPEYRGLPTVAGTLAKIRAAPEVRPGSLREARFANAQALDREGFFGRVYSSSYVIHGLAPVDRPAFDEALLAIFARHQRDDGTVDMAYDADVIAWQL
jgi:hypothetical protein